MELRNDFSMWIIENVKLGTLKSTLALLAYILQWTCRMGIPPATAKMPKQRVMKDYNIASLHNTVL